MRRKMIICLLLVVIFSFPNIPFVYGQSLYQIAEADGYANGELLGELAAQRDYINNNRSDWLKAHQEEEKRIIALYQLDKETYVYRFNFLRGFRNGFREGYERIYKEFSEQKVKTDYDYGLDHGIFFGRLLGNVDGLKEFHAGRSNDWKRVIPSDTTITRDFSLNRDNSRYSSSFIIGFKIGYEENFTYSFRNANVENHRLTKEIGVEHGVEMGRRQGEAFGQMDFIDGKNNDWKRAIPRDQEILIKANLLRENSQYREGFLGGYKEGFKEGYTLTFQDANISNALDNLNYTYIAMMGGTILSSDGMLNLTINPGSIYWETYFALEKDSRPIYLTNTSRLEAITNPYNLTIANHIGHVKLNEPIKLEFKFYGSERAGIYQWINGQWQYLYSRIENNTISTVVPVGVYQGGTYAVFVDPKYPELKDIYTHWASEEIYTFVRRSHVSGYSDQTFRPSEHVSRGEFVTLLSRILNWNTISGGAVISFVDEEEFGVHKNAIMQAVSRGYLSGYADQTFRAKNPITYQEIEWIMERIVGSKGFKWTDIEDKMLYEKYTRSQSRHSMGNRITRGEIIYMLHELQKDGKI